MARMTAIPLPVRETAARKPATRRAAGVRGFLAMTMFDFNCGAA
jgi:hypothetical protein